MPACPEHEEYVEGCVRCGWNVDAVIARLREQLAEAQRERDEQEAFVRTWAVVAAKYESDLAAVRGQLAALRTLVQTLLDAKRGTTEDYAAEDALADWFAANPEQA